MRGQWRAAVRAVCVLAAVVRPSKDQKDRKHALMITESTPATANPARLNAAPFNAGSTAALALLWHAHNCAQDAGTDLWDFALETVTLYEAGLTISDLRWLVAKGFAVHGQETSVYGGLHRSFRPGAGFFFEPTTCIVLTSEGVAFAEHLLRTLVATSPTAPPPFETTAHGNGQTPGHDNHAPATHDSSGSATAAVKPRWNLLQRELCLGVRVVKRFRVPAHVQQLIICAFEEEGWPAHIDDPLPCRRDIDPRARLHDAIHRLNGHQINRLLRFKGNGSGTGVSWELRRADTGNNRHQIAT
jgi:hypothetical protein